MMRKLFLLLFLWEAMLFSQEFCGQEEHRAYRSVQRRSDCQDRFYYRNYYWLHYPYCYDEWDQQQNNEWPSKRETELWDYLTGT